MDWASAPDHIKHLVASIDQTEHLLMASLFLRPVIDETPRILSPVSLTPCGAPDVFAGYSRSSERTSEFLRKPSSPCERRCVRRV